jgi:hypothetical protein
MAEIMKFICKFSGFRTYVNGKEVVFENGSFSTDDSEIIEGLKKIPEFGFTLFEDKHSNSLEKEKEPTPKVESAAEKVEGELEKSPDDYKPVFVTKKAKGKKKE